MVGIMVKIRMMTIHPYLCMYADKVHAAQFVHIESLMAVSVGECMCLLRVRV